MRWRIAGVSALLVVAGCSQVSSPASPTPPASAEPTSTAVAASQATPGLVLVAIGDSIPFNAPGDCPGCIGFVDSYAAALQSADGQPVEVVNRSRHDGAKTSDIVDQLATDDALLEDLARADIVVMSVGFNDQPPFPDAHEGCPPATGDVPIETLVERAAATDNACIDGVVAEVRREIAGVFATVRERAPEATLAALTAYDSWIGWPELAAIDQDTVADLYAAERHWLHQWRDAMCAEADAVDAVCVDVYRAFNGPDGTDPPTDFVAGDYTHPSQTGNDTIRDLLLDALEPRP